MPIPFDDLAEGEQYGAVAWLRFVEEEDSSGIRAALFQTSAQGEPLEFCFTRVDLCDPSIVQRGGNPRQIALATLTKGLFRAAKRTPVLAFGMADEIPASTLATDLRVGLPFCLVRPVEPLPFSGTEFSSRHNGIPPQLLWVTSQPGEAPSDARRVLDELMGRDDTFGPFDRAADCLDKAFGYPRVRGMTSVSGLNAVVSLYPPPERAERPDAPSRRERDRQVIRESNLRSGPGEPSDLRLAELLWAILAAPSKRSIPVRSIELEWPGKLMPFQEDGVRALLDMDRLLLADDMGLGKTIQAIAAMRILWSRREIGSCLVVAPASVLDQWRRELTKWAPELSAIIIRGPAADRSWQWAAERDVALVSYDTLRSDFGYSAQSPVRRRTWDIVVSDESQRIKNRNDTSNALKGLRRVRSWALTGTPIENHEEELASILEFVDHDAKSPPKRYSHGPELLKRHRELQLRRKKSDVLEDLPPKQVAKLTIGLHPSQRASYDKAEQDGIIYLKSLGAEVGILHVLELIVRLKQICNADPKTGESSKMDDIRDRIVQLSAQGHKALVFSQYTSDTSGVAAAAKHLQEFNPLTLTGDMPQDRRTAVIDRFKTTDKHKVMLLSLRAGGLGLNLQEASYVFHLDRWWNPAIERQAEDRSHRIGQTVKVNVIKYSCTGTIEERIDQILERKQGLFDQLIDDVSLDLSTQLSREELFGLFGLDK